MVKKFKDILTKVKEASIIKKVRENPIIKDTVEITTKNKKKLIATFAPPIIGAIAAGSLFAFLFYRHRKKKKIKEETL